MTQDEFEEAWERASPSFERALKYGGDMWSLDGVKREVLEGRAHFWANEDAYAVTRFDGGDLVRVLWYWLMGGTTRGLDALRPIAEVFAIENNCLVIAGEGRAGWERRFGRKGYRALATLYVKDLRQEIGMMQ